MPSIVREQFVSVIRPTLDVFPNNARCPQMNSQLKLHYISIKAIISVNSPQFLY